MYGTRAAFATLVIYKLPYEGDLEELFSGIIDLEKFADYLHFELLRSTLLRKMETKPFRQFLVDDNKSDLNDDSYRVALRKLEVLIKEKGIDFCDVDETLLMGICTYDGQKEKRYGFPMNAVQFAQWKMANALGIEKGQSLYRFTNYKNVNNKTIIDYYKRYDNALLSNMPLYSASPEHFTQEQKIAYAVQAINFDLLENERAMEFIYCLAVSFAQLDAQAYDSLYSIYSPFVQFMLGCQRFPYGDNEMGISRHPSLFLEHYIAEIPKWNDVQRAEELIRFKELCVAFLYMMNCLKDIYDQEFKQSNEQLIEEMCRTLAEYPIFNSYGISQRKSDFTREWPGKSLSYYRKLVGELYMPRKNTGTSEE